MSKVVDLTAILTPNPGKIERVSKSDFSYLQMIDRCVRSLHCSEPWRRQPKPGSQAHYAMRCTRESRTRMEVSRS